MRNTGPKYIYITAGILIIVTIFSASNIKTILSLSSRLGQYKEKLSDIQEKNKKLEKEIRLAREEKDHLEFLARKKLGMIKEGETKYYIIEDTGSEKNPG